MATRSTKRFNLFSLFKLQPAVVLPSMCLVGALLLFATLVPQTLDRILNHLKTDIFTHFSWFYVLAVGILLFGALFLCLSRFGDIRLGVDDAQPQYSTNAWFAMLFTTGMGIGIMFFGVAEPVMHFMSPPVGIAGTQEAAREAMHLTFFHWGLHAWAIDGVVGLIIAYFGFRKGLPLTLRSALSPLIGKRIFGPIGDSVDTFAVLGTIFGVATSLGFGALQVNAGLHHLFDVPINVPTQVTLIIVITALASFSVGSGLDRGIRLLSNLNLWLAIFLLALVFTLGPTVYLLKAFVENTGSYLSGIVEKTFNLYSYTPADPNWLGGWTLLYWAWWLSWSPFVGLFIARISRGRTIREFVLGVLVVPALFTFLWMTGFGNTAIYLISEVHHSALAQAVLADPSVALFKFFTYFPASSLLSFVGMMMVVIFFVTSADSGALVVDQLMSGGSKETPVIQRVFWSALTGLVALILLISGGLGALQTLTLITALPFALILIVALIGLMRSLHRDDLKRRSRLSTACVPAARAGWNHGPSTLAGTTSRETWQKRLKTLVFYPDDKRVANFLNTQAAPALRRLASALRREGLVAEASNDLEQVNFRIGIDGHPDFVLSIKLCRYALPECGIAADASPGFRDDLPSQYARAEILLKEGSRDYDVMGWSESQLIHAVLDEYESHLAYLRKMTRPDRLREA